jgi:hypothetical protein
VWWSFHSFSILCVRSYIAVVWDLSVVCAKRIRENATASPWGKECYLHQLVGVGRRVCLMWERDLESGWISFSLRGPGRSPIQQEVRQKERESDKHQWTACSRLTLLLFVACPQKRETTTTTTRPLYWQIKWRYLEKWFLFFLIRVERKFIYYCERWLTTTTVVICCCCCFLFLLYKYTWTRTVENSTSIAYAQVGGKARASECW